MDIEIFSFIHEAHKIVEEEFGLIKWDEISEDIVDDIDGIVSEWIVAGLENGSLIIKIVQLLRDVEYECRCSAWGCDPTINTVIHGWLWEQIMKKWGRSF